MTTKLPHLLVITPINHIQNLRESLENSFQVTLSEHVSLDELEENENIEYVFVNPNQLLFQLDADFFCKYPQLKAIATASTGTNHINKEDAADKNIQIFSLTNERETINKISSTAEHALALTLSASRNITTAFAGVLSGGWEYTPYVGRQIKELTIGVIGYGRLGTLYAHYLDSMGARVCVYDPYKDVSHPRITKIDCLEDLAKQSDIISIHVHVLEETIQLVDQRVFNSAKSDLLLVNTSRGEIVDESALLNFLSENSKSKYATDVLAHEYIETDTSQELIAYAQSHPQQVLITPHIAGFTREFEQLAYHKGANLLIYFETQRQDTLYI